MQKQIFPQTNRIYISNGGYFYCFRNTSFLADPNPKPEKEEEEYLWMDKTQEIQIWLKTVGMNEQDHKVVVEEFQNTYDIQLNPELFTNRDNLSPEVIFTISQSNTFNISTNSVFYKNYILGLTPRFCKNAYKVYTSISKNVHIEVYVSNV